VEVARQFQAVVYKQKGESIMVKRHKIGFINPNRKGEMA
jgi:hypothetical protein